MSRTLTNRFLMVIAFLGVIVTSILTFQHFRPGAGGLCKAGPTGCDGVLHSAYGKIGPIPTAILGLGMYLTFLYLGWERSKLLRRQADVERHKALAYAAGDSETAYPTDANVMPQLNRLNQFMWLMALAALGISWWLQYTSIFYLGAFCPWCFSSALLVTLLFLITSYDFHFAGKQATGEQKMLIGVSAFIFVLLCLMWGPDVMVRYKAIQEGPREVVQPPGGQGGQFNVNEIVNGARWWEGPKDAKLTVVEFADYQCGNCALVSKNLKEYMKRMPGNIRLGFRNFPVPLASHKWSRQAAITAEAAGQQGKFWEMHDYIFEHQEDMKQPDFIPERFVEFAKEVGLDIPKFRKDIADKVLIAKVDSDSEVAMKNNVTGTPTAFFVNGSQVHAVQGDAAIQAVLMDPSHKIWQKQ
jgi:protein-disulfide isomerase/uncharacterized membrane protein